MKVKTGLLAASLLAASLLAQQAWACCRWKGVGCIHCGRSASLSAGFGLLPLEGLCSHPLRQEQLVYWRSKPFGCCRWKGVGCIHCGRGS